ncbi:MAG: (Fe-S)-binding protein [Sulfurospirillum sp.]|nr:MAG: (Fe-S)-binding protein [Sulfurospirillum sp.]
MKIGLFIPCFMNELYPDVCMATLRLLQNLGLDVEYPLDQTCCGQPVANSGCAQDVQVLAYRFVDIFQKYDYIVAPSASCVVMVKEHYGDFFDASDEGYAKVQSSVYEVCEFLHDIVKPKRFDLSFPYRVGVHNSCHGQRGLNLASASELQIPHFSKIKNLLSLIDDITLVDLDRDDECCGFGGTFSILEPELSAAMGNDRVQDHLDSGAEVMTGADMSCLMHMEGLIRKNGQKLKVMHITQILAGEKV